MGCPGCVSLAVRRQVRPALTSGPQGLCLVCTGAVVGREARGDPAGGREAGGWVGVRVLGCPGRVSHAVWRKARPVLTPAPLG